MMSPNATRRTAHIESLAKAHWVSVINEPNRKWARADYLRCTIYIKCPCRTSTDYLLALHELGHIVLKQGPLVRNARRHGAGELAIEAAAWQWALQHAEPALLSRKAERHAQHCLWSYTKPFERENVYDRRALNRTIQVLTIFLGFSLAILLGM